MQQTMQNKQTTVLQELIEWGDQMMKDHPMKTLSFADAIDKAVELLDKEKEQINQAFYNGYYEEFLYDAREYYNKTYNNNGRK